MVLSFFHNACILITFISIAHHFLRDKNIFQSQTFRGKIVVGLFCGLLGIILMLNSVHIKPKLIIDFRYIPILLSAFYCGFLPSIISSCMIGIFRLFFLGVSPTSINALITAVVMGIEFGIISSVKLPQKSKWIYSMFFLIMTSSVSSWIAIQEKILFIQSISLFLAGNLMVSYFSIKYIEYIIETVQIYHNLKNEATKDYLTGLSNVRQFDNSFNIISESILRKEEKLSLLLIDIDFFKKINDNFGHNAGDNILKSIATIFLNTCRTYDVVSRNGGEEFSILLLDCSLSKAAQIAERIREIVEKNNFYISDKETVNITISIGVSSYPETTSQIDKLLENSDTALYEAKRNGRNKVVLFTQ